MADNNSPDDNVFDNISRILASPMPRRQAIKVAAGAVGAAAMMHFSSLRLLGAPAAQAGKTVYLDVLKLPVIGFSVESAKVYEVINTLRYDYHASISLIEAPQEKPVSINIVKGTVKDVLDSIIKQNSAYRLRRVGKRLILMPDDPKFQQVVSGIDVVGVPRAKATAKYIDYLRTHVLGFEKFSSGQTMVGNMDAPLFTAPVTLKPKATVLEDYFLLLGNNPALSFSIVKAMTGVYASGVFEATPVTQEKPATQKSPRHTPANFSQRNNQLQQGMPLVAAADAVCRPLQVGYALDHQEICGGSATVPCGADYFNRLTLVLCSGVDDDCTGATLTETLGSTTFTGQCPPPMNAGGGAGCAIINGNQLVGLIDPSKPCYDNYGVCLPGDQFSGTCTITVSQSVSVDGVVVQTNDVVSVVTSDGGRTPCTLSAPQQKNLKYTHTSVDCCGTGGAASIPYLCDHTSQHCINGDICCATNQLAACNHHCCQPGYTCAQDGVTLLQLCCPSDAPAACNGTCCKAGEVCNKPSQTCCPSGQVTSDGKTCCTSSQIVCATACCDSATQVCTNGICCGKPKPQARMSHAQVLQGRYATDDLSLCCQPGQVPCVNACCDAGSVCCSGSCCAGTCDSSGTCITNNENK